MDVSVIVSTRNRAAEVRKLLACMDAIVVRPGLEWELIIVDNGSSDGTAGVVREFAAKAGFPVRYAFAARQGKSFGLNAGLAIATGRIIAFTDDDVVVPPDWISRFVEYLEATPECSCVGGMIKLHDPTAASLSVRLSEERKVVDLSNFPTMPVLGGNVAMRAEVIRAVGEYDTDMCPGSRVGGSEDVDMLYRVLRAGYVVHYEPRMQVSHNHAHRTPAEIARALRTYGTGWGAFYLKHVLRGDRTVARWAYWDFYRSIRHPLRWKTAEGLRRGGWLLLGIARYICYRERRP